jgi:hypothetical protein
METAVKTLKEEVIEQLIQSDNVRLFEAVKQEIESFRENGSSVHDLWEMLFISEHQIRKGEVFSQEEVEKQIQTWKNRREK